MKSEEQLKKELINALKKQAESLEQNNFEAYKHERLRIHLLEEVLELY